MHLFRVLRVYINKLGVNAKHMRLIKFSTRLDSWTLKWFAIPLTLISFLTITVEFKVSTDGGYGRVFGLPLPFISEQWVNTGHHSIFILPLLIDLLLYFAIWTFLVYVFRIRIVKSVLNRVLILIIGACTLYILLPTIGCIIVDDNSYSIWTDQAFDVQNYSLRLGLYP